MGRCSEMEKTTRTRTVAQWIVEGHSYTDIVNNITLNWEIDERQAKRYISDALQVFVEENDIELDQKKAFYQKARLDNYQALVKERKSVMKNEDINIETKVNLLVKLTNVIDKLLTGMSKIDGVYIDKVDVTSKGDKIGNSGAFKVAITPSGTTVTSGNSNPSNENNTD
jgi:hypothetical protein